MDDCFLFDVDVACLSRWPGSQSVKNQYQNDELFTTKKKTLSSS